MHRFWMMLTIVLLASGSAMAASEYTPSAQAIAALSTDQALKILNSPENAPAFLVVSDKYQYVINNFKASLGRLEIRDEDGPNPNVRWADLELNVSYAGFLSPGKIGLTSQYALFYQVEDPQLRLIADAFAVLQNAVRVGPRGDPAFAQVVASYRAAQPKPHLSEDVRRYEVQAEAAVKDGDFPGAASCYSQALQIAPWWPGGHFNRAAVLAEIGEYDLAIDELQRYLLLVPDAPDARASQDKIYVWQRLADRAGTTAPSAESQASAPEK